MATQDCYFSHILFCKIGNMNSMSLIGYLMLFKSIIYKLHNKCTL